MSKMIDSIPEIDKRDSSKILDEISNLIPYYVPKWNPSYNKDDLAVGLSKAYANLLDNVIYKLNQVPQRNFIEFLNVLGVTLTSKQAAKVPVTMTLTKGIEKNILVPKQTEVVAKATSAHDELTFITDSDLLVTFSDLVKICSVEKDMNGLDTKIYDHTDNMLKREPFSFFTGENLQEHVLYISHNDLFNLETREITISFQSNESKSSKDNEQLTSIFSNPALIRWEYNWEIDKTTGKEIPDSAKQMRFYNTQENSILLEKNPTKIKEIIVHGIKSRWIRCRLKPQNIDSPNFVTSNANLRRDFLNAMNCPKISKLEISIPPPSKNLGSKSFYDQLEKPEMIFSGETPLQKNSFYPFGKNVNISNIFYVSSPLFSKKGLSIEILLDYSSELLSSENNNSDDNEGDIDKSYLHYNKIDILWEFWNGNGWVLLDSIRSDRFPRGWILGLKCPDTIKPSSVNGHENYWIRGRIDPSYFTNKTKVVQKDNIFEIDYGFGDLPKITGINVSISEQSSDYGYAPQHCIAYNNLEYENCIDASNSSLKIKPFRAFKTYEIDSPSVFFGFDKKIEGGPINIFISSLKKNYLTNLENQDNFVSNLNYYCSSKNNSWEKISSSDNTYGFSKTGTIQIIFPSKFTNSKIFSDDLYWVMAKDESQKYTINKTQGNLINGILLNTVEVLHGTKIVELLGTSDYSLNQKFKLTNSPISENKIKLLVNEFGFVKDNEKEFLLSQKKIYKDSATLPDELWVEWDEVQDLYSTDSNDRKFVLDRES
ncbi:MAG: hypothetical protein OES14_06680, partial [Nitrosopumilus sp.]|nr:hypothetical protein [Nitrosopumilus sp.]